MELKRCGCFSSGARGQKSSSNPSMRAREGRDPDRRPGVNAPNHLTHPSACAEGASERAAAHGGGEIDRSQRDYASAGESRFPIAAHDREGHAGDAGREKAEANHPDQPKLGLAKSAPPQHEK